mgnify:CR=1 FL=1
MRELVELVTNELNKQGLMLATAESCTGGMIAAAMTERAGSSSVFERGFVTYSNDSKQELLDVSREILEKHGAVSAEAATAMVQGVLDHSHANMAISVTGIAGPSGGTPEKPVGLVYIGWGRKGGKPESARYVFSGDRASVRKQSAETALKNILHFLQTK